MYQLFLKICFQRRFQNNSEDKHNSNVGVKFSISNQNKSIKATPL